MATMRHQRQEPESFADFVRRARSDPEAKRPGAQSWPQPIRDGHWTDDNGTHWHIRGRRGQLPQRVLRRLLKRPDLRVLHAYGPNPTEVSGLECEALLERVERYFAGEAPPHSVFWLAEFRDDNRHVMLVIEEAC
jgi:hypothetical protein